MARTMSGRAYLSIGDVLSLLREEFPDVTISKIRFLESQGLVDPERSPSGYRKFYDDDVARLRWVLRKQRDQFLPLKVIRDRLAAAGSGVPPDDDPDDGPADGPADDAGSTWSAVGVGAVVGPSGLAGTSATAAATAAASASISSSAPAAALREGVHAVVGTGAQAANGVADVRTWTEARADAEAERPEDRPEDPRDASTADVRERDTEQRAASGRHVAQEPHPQHEPDEAHDPASGAASPVVRRPATDPARPARPATAQPAARAGAATPASGPAAPAAADVLSPSVSGVSLTLAELCAATGLAPEAVASLEGLGLLAPMHIAGGAFYDEEALTVGKLAVEFGRFGIEPRHLRMFRNAVEREVGVVEQVIAPLLRQRNPEARQRAVDTAAELARLGQSMRASLVRSELRRQLGGVGGIGG